MKVNFTTKQNPNKSTDKQGLGMMIIFYALNIILVPFSAYQTFLGYTDFLGFLPAIMVATVSGLIFFGLNHTIREKRVAGQPHFKLILGYLLPLGISFFGNFNAFYSGQMKGELLEKELSVYETTFEKTFSAGMTQVNASTGLSTLDLQYTSQLSKFKNQIDKQGGFGPLAKIEWDALDDIFAKYTLEHVGSEMRMTPISNVGKNTPFKTFESVANGLYNSIVDVKDQQLHIFIDPLQAEHDSLIDSFKLIQKNKRIKDEGFDLLASFQKKNNEIGNKIKAYLQSAGAPEFKFQELQASGGRQIGTIKHSLKSAFIDFDSPSATAFSTFFSVLIDIIPLGFLFLVVSYTNNGRVQRKNHRTL